VIRLSGVLALFASGALAVALSRGLSHEDYRMKIHEPNNLLPGVDMVLVPTKNCHPAYPDTVRVIEPDAPPGSNVLLTPWPDPLRGMAGVGDAAAFCYRGFKLPWVGHGIERWKYCLDHEGTTRDFPAGPAWPIYAAYTGISAAPLILWPVAAGIAALAAGRGRRPLDS
jgi:hypothetical protein